MPGKVFVLDDGQSITVFKRKGSRSLRMSIVQGDQVRVTIPSWTPYKAGVAFAKARQEWIREQVVTPTHLKSGQAIGKAHHLLFSPTANGSKPVSRTMTAVIKVQYPPHMHPEDPEVQAVAREACVRALRAQAEKLLPQRLADLAAKHNFSYNSVSVKRLKGRWGSCDQHQNIIFNLYLMQLPWDLIDYVILHELTHTQILRHGPDFWDAMNHVLPAAKSYRKRMQAHQPTFG